jgi:hypothetical protein
MKNQLTVIIFLFVCSNLFAQKNFVIEYDKISENTLYFENVKGSDRLKPMRAIFPRKGDHVQLIVKNLNPFIYKVNIDVNEEDNTPTTSSGNSELFSLLGNLALGTNLSFVNDLPGSRGEGSVSANKKKISDIHNQLISIQGEYLSASMRYKELIKTMTSESMPVDSIKKNSLEIIQSLETENQTEKSKTQVKLLERDLASIQPSDAEESNLLTSEKALIAELSKVSTIKKSDLERLKEVLLASKSEINKKHTVGYSQSGTYSDDGYGSSSSEVSTDVIFKLNITRNNYLDQLSKAKTFEFNQEDYIEYYNVSRWKNENGIVTNEFCDKCKPILLATGYIKPDGSGNYKVPSSYLDLFSGVVPGAYGEWKIYDEDEKIQNSFMLSQPTSSSEQTSNSEEEETTEVVRVKCQESNAPRWSSGLFLTNPISGRSQFSIIESSTSDSLMILQEKSTSLLPSIGATLSFQPLTSNLVSLTYNLGLSVNTFSNIDENKINLLGGIGLTHRDFKYFSVSAGACLSRTSELKNMYQASTWYSSSSTTYNKLLYNESIDTITQYVFKLGYYIGFHFNF